MASIIGLADQQKALKEIKNSLKDLTTINEFLEAQNSSGVYTITFTSDDNKKYSTDIIVESKESINALAIKNKQKRCEDIVKKAEEYKIGLDSADKKILGIEE